MRGGKKRCWSYRPPGWRARPWGRGGGMVSWRKVGLCIWVTRAVGCQGKKEGAPALGLALQQGQVLQRWMTCSLPPKSSQISCDNHSLGSSFSKYFLDKRADICARELILLATQPELDVQPPKAERRGPPAPDSNEPGRVTRCTVLSPDSSTCVSLP